MTTHFLKLPSGDFLNLAAIAHVEDQGTLCHVHFTAAGPVPRNEDYSSTADIELAYTTYNREDRDAIVAALTAQAAENEAIREVYRQVVAEKQEAAQ